MAAFLSLALPKALPQRWVDRFFAGLLRLAERYGVDLAGGDTSQSPGGVLADIAVLGSVARGKALRRSGAQVGDQIYVTGALGESAAALQLLTKEKIKRRDIFPEPRIAIGEWLVKNRVASACIDISDGLSTDLAHICEESGVGALIEAKQIPIRQAASHLNNSLQLALHGGEDYELLFTASTRKKIPSAIGKTAITRIGEIINPDEITLVKDSKREGLIAKGWQHFSEWVNLHNKPVSELLFC